MSSANPFRLFLGLLKSKKALLLLIIIIAIAYGLWRHYGGKRVKTAPQPPAIAVQVSAVKVHTIPLTYNAIGTVISPKTVMLKAQQAGEIKAIYFKSGQMVKKGEALLQIDNQSQKAALAEARANLFRLASDYKRNLQLAKQAPDSISQNDLDQKLGDVKAAQAAVQVAKQALDHTTVRAPFTGRIAALQSLQSTTAIAGSSLNQSTQIAVGGYVDTGDNLVVMSDPKAILVQYQLPQSYAPQMATNQPVTVELPVLEQETELKLQAVVSYISPTLIEDSHAYLVRARLTTKDVKQLSLLRPGTSVSVTQTLDSKRQILAVPGLSLIPSLTGYSVYMIENHKVKAVPVETGARYNTWVAVTSGLKAGDQIITSGLQSIHPGSTVKVVSPSSQD